MIRQATIVQFLHTKRERLNYVSLSPPGCRTGGPWCFAGWAGRCPAGVSGKGLRSSRPPSAASTPRQTWAIAPAASLKAANAHRVYPEFIARRRRDPATGARYLSWRWSTAGLYWSISRRLLGVWRSRSRDTRRGSQMRTRLRSYRTFLRKINEHAYNQKLT